MNGNLKGWMIAGVLSGAAMIARASAAETWTTAENDGRIEASIGGKTVFAWQAKPLAKPTGGEKFAGSAFLHPLRTPSGFEWTAIQPADHLHHFGLWWPWKYIEVNGVKMEVDMRHARRIEEIRIGDKVKVVKINIDDNPMTAGRFGVRGLPTFMIFQDGQVTATHLGAMNKSRLAEWLKESAPSLAQAV